MAWNETRPGRWQRPLGENEAMIKLIGDGGKNVGKDAWCISMTASLDMIQRTIDHRSTEKMLKEGWKLLRYRHPSIATTVDDRNVLTYDVPNEQALEAWVNESFVVLQGDKELDAVTAILRPRPCATLYWLEARNDIVLQLSHWRTDGIGAFHVLNAFFSAVVEGSHLSPQTKPQWGREVIWLLPSVEEALGLPLQADARVENATDQFFATLAHSFNALPLPFRSSRGTSSPGKTRNAHLRLSRQQTNEMQWQCQQKGISLEAAVHASVTATAYSIAEPTSSPTHHTTTMRQSLRSHLPVPYNGTAGAAGLYTAGYMIKVPAGQTWYANARRYEAEISAGASPELLCSRRCYALRMIERLKTLPPAPPNPPPSSLDVSYVPDVDGLMSTRYGNEDFCLEVRDVSIGIEVLSRHMYVFMWVFDGSLAFRLVYNDAFYDEDFGRQVLDLVKRHLLWNLGLQDP